MPSSTLAQKISDTLKTSPGSSDPTIMNQIVADELTSYLRKNVTIQTESGTHGITGVVSPALPSSLGLEGWLDNIGHCIATGFITLPGTLVKPLEKHLSLNVPNDHLSEFVEVSIPEDSLDTCYDFWDCVCTGIFDMLDSQVSSSFPATGIKSGIATVTKIIIK